MLYCPGSGQELLSAFGVTMECHDSSVFLYFIGYSRGVARIFQKGGGGGHTVSNIIVMAFSPRNIVGCLLKKSFTRGRGVKGTPGPSPRYALV